MQDHNAASQRASKVSFHIDDSGTSHHRQVRVFRQSMARVPNNPIVRAAVKAVLNGGPRALEFSGGWFNDESGLPRFRTGKGASGIIEVYPDQIGISGRPSGLAPREVVARLDPLVADVMLALLSILCAREFGDRTKFPSHESIDVQGETIRKLIGDRSFGARRAEQIGRIAGSIDCLATLRFNVVNASGVDPATRRWVTRALSWQGDSLFDLVRDPTGTVWRVRFGQWAHWWLNINGALWLSELPQSLLTLDRRRSRASFVMAKKIGFTMTLFSPSNKPVRRRIENLLADVGELPASPFRSAHWAGRTRERLEEALLHLSELDLFEVSWPNRSFLQDDYRPRGWVDDWLSSNIEYRSKLRAGAPRATLRNHSAAVESNAVAFSAGRGMRIARHKRKLTQTALASVLGISQAHLSRIETGRAPLDPIIAARAWKTLDPTS